MNRILLIGNLGKDPEMNYTPSGVPVTKFSIAVNRFSKDANGERQDETEWFNIVAWRQLAETCSKFLVKGNKVFIEGRLSMRKYNDKNGNERLAVEVIASDMEMLTPKSSSSAPPEDESLGELDENPF